MGTTAGGPEPGRRRGSPPRVLRLALEHLEICRRHERALEKARAFLNLHIGKAADSVLLNIGEAFDEPSPGDKRRFFRYALRSVGEAEKGWRGVQRLRLIPAEDVAQALRLVRDLRLDLRRLIRWSA